MLRTCGSGKSAVMSLLKNLFGEQQMAALADYVPRRLHLRRDVSERALDPPHTRLPISKEKPLEGHVLKRTSEASGSSLQVFINTHSLPLNESQSAPEHMLLARPTAGGGFRGHQ